MGTYRLRVPASRVGYVPDAQGGSPPGPHVQYVRGTRTSLGRWVRTAYCGTPGFNIFVENLSESVNEIHRDVQSNLPSMDAGGDSDNDDSDGEAEVPILTPRGARIAAAAREGAS